MIRIHLWIFFSVILTLVQSLERGSSCKTPNYEVATCISINDCEVFKTALASYNESTVEFAQKSQCGFDTDPLVCCGSIAYSKPHLPYDIFTRKPPTKSPVTKKPTIDLNFVSSNSLPDRSVCGKEREVPRLIGGTATALDEFPWMAIIGYKNKDDNVDVGFKCGGTLVNNKYVLTAAHCVLTEPERFIPYRVRLGEWRLSTEQDCVVNIAVEECSEPVVDINIKDSIPHPFFSARSGNNDIALLRLEDEVRYSDFIRPICLPPPNLPTPAIGTVMTVCGWGAFENGSQSDVKQKVEIPLVANTRCTERISSQTHISANQICAGGVKGKDACQGDSGGPLMRTYTDDESQWYQEGIVSRGRGCGKENYPGVYTRVTRYVSWILNNIEFPDRENK